MNKNKVFSFALAALGLIITGVLLYGAIKFYRTVSSIVRNNPSLVHPRDSLRAMINNDTLVDFNASLNQQIAQKLMDKHDDEKNGKQILLYQTITDFLSTIDTLQNTDMAYEEKRMRLKNSVNKTNLGCRSSLFNIKDAEETDVLNTFVIADEKKLENTIFECFSQKEIEAQCFEKIKHEALHLEMMILEKNFRQLNL